MIPTAAKSSASIYGRELSHSFLSRLGDRAGRPVTQYLRTPECFLLLAAALFVAARAGKDFALEDLQTLLFPIFLYCFWRLPSVRALSLPLWTLPALVLCWGLSALHVRGYLPGPWYTSGVYLSRLAGDRDGLSGREFLVSYEQTADKNFLPRMEVLQRTFSSKKEARDWVAKTGAAALVWGDAEWVEVVLPRAVFSAKSPTIKLAVPGTGLLFDYAVAPESFVLPRQSADLARRFLAWLMEGVRWDADIERQEFALSEAVSVVGPWASNTPRSTAYFLRATHRMLRLGASSERGELECVNSDLHRAAAKLQARYAPELAAVIYNNMAVMTLLQAQNRGDYRSARKILRQASVQRNAAGESTQGALIARANLQTLELSKLAD